MGLRNAAEGSRRRQVRPLAADDRLEFLADRPYLGRPVLDQTDAQRL